VNQAIVQRFPGIEYPAGQGEFGGTPLSHGRFHCAEYQDRPQTDPDLGQSEGRLLSGDEDVGVGRQTRPSSQRRTAYTGNNRLAEAVPRGKKLFVKLVQLGPVGL